jgi:hypothetical protein
MKPTWNTKWRSYSMEEKFKWGILSFPKSQNPSPQSSIENWVRVVWPFHNKIFLSNIMLWFYIWKQRISLFEPRIYLGLTKIDLKTTRSWSKSTPKQLKVDQKGPKNDSMSPGLRNSRKSLKWVSKNSFRFGNRKFHYLGLTFVRGWPEADLEWPGVDQKGPKNYTSSPTIDILCTFLKQISKYDFRYRNWEFHFSGIATI